jgi:hypothetical protein
LTGVSDNDSYFPTNWVRSGDYAPNSTIGDQGYECLPDGPTYLNPCNYADEGDVDPKQSYERILEGTIAPHRLTGHQADYMPMAYFGNYTASSKQNASISFLPSVNIIITSDKSKWTRVPVIELGRNAGLNLVDVHQERCVRVQVWTKTGIQTQQEQPEWVGSQVTRLT